MWINVPRVASTSMATALGYLKYTDLMFAFIRHPWDRMVSALTMFEPGVPIHEAYERQISNYHIRPQAEHLAPFMDRLDFLGRYDRLEEDWRWVIDNVGAKPLQHLNKTDNKPDWREIDFSRYLDRYQQDFDLCPEWLP